MRGGQEEGEIKGMSPLERLEHAMALFKEEDRVRDEQWKVLLELHRVLSPPARTSARDTVHISAVREEDVPSLKREFKETYGADKIAEFHVPRAGEIHWMRVRFVDSATQERCLDDATHWSDTYHIQVRRYTPLENDNKRRRV